RMLRQRIAIPGDDLLGQFGMRREDLGSVAPILKANEFVARIAGDLRVPAHHLRGMTVVFVVSGSGREQRDPGVLLQVLHSIRIGSAGQQYERTYFGMPAGEFDDIIYAASAAARANAALVNAGLREQRREGGIEIAGPFCRYLPLEVGSCVVGTWSAAFVYAALVIG